MPLKQCQKKEKFARVYEIFNFAGNRTRNNWILNQKMGKMEQQIKGNGEKLGLSVEKCIYMGV